MHETLVECPYSFLIWESTSLKMKPRKFTPWLLNLSNTTHSPQTCSFPVLAQPAVSTPVQFWNLDTSLSSVVTYNPSPHPVFSLIHHTGLPSKPPPPPSRPLTISLPWSPNSTHLQSITSLLKLVIFWGVFHCSQKKKIVINKFLMMSCKRLTDHTSYFAQVSLILCLLSKHNY